MCLLCITSFRGPPIGGQDSDGVSNRRSVLYTLCLFEAFPSRGNEKIGGTGYCVTYDTDSQSRNVLASPLGEEGHEVAKGCTKERMIMILYGDVTAERRHYNTLRPIGRYRNPQRRRRCRPPERSEHNLPPSGGHNLRAKGACPLGPDPDLASRTG
ncbi:hypothetical protein HMPREF9453_00432 [Dialister succinatiphilus YIT 11850]|uniref:Uncharacterized protein n=1 Tax=Dialister succinatiphilus YIT 11850 TaxID=742743 RepID=H1CYJ4_9FIRM|nr:hypothetical protein HMPREF9453_00432 [Dialister succinatiphilus YIT 11850]